MGLQAPVFVLHGFLLLANRRNHCYANSVVQTLHWVVPTAELSLLQDGKRVEGPLPRDKAKARTVVNVVKTEVHRHDEQLMALTTDLGYISYVRTDAHSVLPELHEESKRHRAMLAPAAPPRHHDSQVLSRT